MNVGIIGSGYVGLVTGTCLAEFGCSVICADKDLQKIDRLSRGEPTIFEPGLAELLRRNLAAGRLRFTTDVPEALRESLVVFVTVGTPPRGDGSADLQYIEDVARLIGKHLDGYKVIVTKSTVPVGTGRWLRGLIEEELPVTDTGERPVFDVVSNPEFLREGAAVEDFLRPERVIIGTESAQAAAILQDLYRPFYRVDVPVVTTTVETAELIKYASNAFLATKISFVNELSGLCEAIGVDVGVVSHAMGLDQRIGPRFLQPGPGFGGSCFPKDLRALVQVATAHGVPLSMAETALRVNQQHRRRMVAKIVRATLGPTAKAWDPTSREPVLAGRAIGVLGLAFKANTDDVRDAAALEILPRLVQLGAQVRAYDPAAMEQAAPHLSGVELVADAYEAVAGADTLVILTEWPEFRALEYARVRAAMRGGVLIDLRNILDPGRMRVLGFRYEGVGRAVTPAGHDG
jgi:UDPglucose 6-dehydrogenase